MAERVGFEPTVPLPGRMLSKHVDSSTLAPLRIKDVFSIKGSILARMFSTGKASTTRSCTKHSQPKRSDSYASMVTRRGEVIAFYYVGPCECHIKDRAIHTRDRIPSVVWVDTCMGPTVQRYTTSRLLAISITSSDGFSSVLHYARVAELADARDLGSRG